MESTEQLERDVRALAAIGPRNLRDVRRALNLAHAASYVSDRLGEIGYLPSVDRFEVAGHVVDVLVAERRGVSEPDRTLVVGAHYDTNGRSPGGPDDATGIALLLATAAHLRGRELARTVRLVAFPNEERPFSRTSCIGSRVYARRCRERGDRIEAMIALEDIGRRTSAISDFVAVVSNLRSRHLARRVHESLGALRTIRARKVILPGFLPLLRSSDPWSFWREGVPAVMLADGALLRPRQPHGSAARQMVDFGRLQEVARAVADAVMLLAS
ncbi:MAG: M28 family peptidase [Deltaproteobacteria bacterium]|nr:M28 family peptidase [Deltaproteobacteria bacterium]